MLTRKIMNKAADIASLECDKNLEYTDMDCEAEKYLEPLRKAVGQETGRFSWCAAFVTWCIRQQVGGILPDEFPTGGTVAYVPSWETWARHIGCWFHGANTDFVPRHGDIVLFDWDEKHEEGDDDHIGLVDSYDGSDVIKTLEGNTGNQTAHKVRNLAIVNGFIRFPT